jgi:hypothetical protein
VNAGADLLVTGGPAKRANPRSRSDKLPMKSSRSASFQEPLRESCVSNCVCAHAARCSISSVQLSGALAILDISRSNLDV